MLNSTSAGASTIDGYIQQELGDQELVFEDPDYQMISNVPHATVGYTTGDIDLEKGGAFPTQMSRKDSALPRLEGGCERAGSSSSGNTCSSHSRR